MRPGGKRRLARVQINSCHRIAPIDRDDVGDVRLRIGEAAAHVRLAAAGVDRCLVETQGEVRWRVAVGHVLNGVDEFEAWCSSRVGHGHDDRVTGVRRVLLQRIVKARLARIEAEGRRRAAIAPVNRNIIRFGRGRAVEAYVQLVGREAAAVLRVRPAVLGVVNRHVHIARRRGRPAWSDRDRPWSPREVARRALPEGGNRVRAWLAP